MALYDDAPCRTASSKARRSRRRGISAAILGPDGCGKTTLAHGIARVSALPVRVVYLGLSRSGRAVRLASFLPGLVLTMRLATVGRALATSAWHRRRGRLVIFDRYTFDSMFHSDRPGMRARLWRAVLTRAAPTPDVIILLDAPGDVMFARKGEHSPTELEYARQQYLSLRDRLPGMTVIDATLPSDEVLRLAVERLLPHTSGAINDTTVRRR